MGNKNIAEKLPMPVHHIIALKKKGKRKKFKTVYKIDTIKTKNVGNSCVLHYLFALIGKEYSTQLEVKMYLLTEYTFNRKAKTCLDILQESLCP